MSQEQQLEYGAIGIDLGSKQSIIAAAKKGGVDILLNEASSRETQNVISYGDTERYLGEAGQTKLKTNFKNTAVNFLRLLGLTKDYPYLKQETKWLTSKYSILENGKIAYDVMYLGEKCQFLPEQITASFLQKLKSIMRLNKLTDKECVVSVPNYFTEQERKALLDAAKIADLKVLNLINESTAIALSYALFRKAELNDQPRNVVFVDIGHSKLSAFCASFTKTKGKILADMSERNLGCRDFDWLMLQHCEQKFQSTSNGESILENKKAIIRILEAIEKQRRILSANSEASIDVEYLVQDIDFQDNITRGEYEKLIDPVLQKMKQLLVALYEELKSKNITVHSVEIIGGGSRIPSVQQIIQDAFQVQSLSKTLNATETIAKGCALKCAIMSPLFKVTDYELEEYNMYPIKISWQFIKAAMQGIEIEQTGNPEQQQAAPQIKSSKLFEKGCTIPNLKSLTFNKCDQINIQLFYDPAPEGFNPLLAQYIVPAVQPKEEKFQNKIRIRLNQDGMVDFYDAALIEDYVEEQKIEIKKPQPQQPVQTAQTAQPQGQNTEQQPQGQANGQQPQQQQPQEQKQPQPTTEQKPAEQTQAQPESAQSKEPEKPNVDAAANKMQVEQKEEPQFEIKQVPKTRTTTIKVKQEVSLAFTPKQIEDYMAIEYKMTNQDKQTQDTLHKKNQLESYIYLWRKNLSEEKAQYAQADTVQQIKGKLDEMEKWLYGEGASSSKGQYAKKLEDIQALCQPIEHRFQEYQKIPQIWKEIESKIQTYEAFVASQDEKYQHITQQERQPVITECERIKQILKTTAEAQKNLQKYNDPSTTSQALMENLKALANVCDPIMLKPKPEPKKEEVKKDEKMDIEKNDKPKEQGDQAETGDSQKPAGENKEQPKQEEQAAPGNEADKADGKKQANGKMDIEQCD